MASAISRGVAAFSFSRWVFLPRFVARALKLSLIYLPTAPPCFSRSLYIWPPSIGVASVRWRSVPVFSARLDPFRLSGCDRPEGQKLPTNSSEDPNFQEVYSLLGVFQFDYRPEHDDSHVEISASYSDNGVLDLKIVQPSSMVELSLYGVSKLAGKRITKPSSPLPIGTPKPMPGGMPAGVPAGAPPPRQWSQSDLEAAVRAANRTQAIAKARLERATPADRQSMQKILASVSEWVGSTWADANTRTPQVRNLNRALINLMFSSRLLSPEELRELEKSGN
jgi:hypothetical protein